VATCLYYSYWRDVPAHPVAVHIRPRRFMVTTPTNDGLTMGITMFPIEEFDSVKQDIESAFWKSYDVMPEVAEKIRAGKRVERFYGTADNLNFFRKPYGDGWVLAGDAGYHKDPITAQGISDAFQTVEWLARAIDAGFSGARPMSEALEEYSRKRDAHFLPMYEFTYGLAGLQPPSPEMLALFGALPGNQADTDGFLGTIAGTVPIPEYYSPANMQRITGGAKAAARA
jgi:2-polyprenyl-6-methoxyphenol hydroxylase-like FAD-dependent oxidoreductase